MGDLSVLIFGFVNIIEDTGLWEALCDDMEVYHSSLIYEIISGTTIE